MRELIRHNTNFNFVGNYPLGVGISAFLVLASILLVIFKGLNYGVDFRGGAEIQIKFQKTVDVGTLRDVLEETGYKSASVQRIGAEHENEFLVKVQAAEGSINELTQAIASSLSKKFQQEGPEIRKTDIVGPKAGAELRNSGIMALAYALLAILIYLTFRFEFKYAPGAILAVMHDAMIIVGVFALTGKEFTLQTVAVMLAIIGYSVNDTVVIYDRLRENEELMPGLELNELTNRTMNETLSRTILTSGATLLVSLSLFFFGGQSLEDFFFAMTVGIVSGTYSTIFVASPVTLYLDKYIRTKNAKKVKTTILTETNLNP